MRAGLQKVVTFAGDVFHGNPAHVLTPPRLPGDEVMKQVVALVGADVLAVIVGLDAEMPELSFFTTGGPHPGAGHATHAAAHLALRQRDALRFKLADGGERSVRRSGAGVSVDWPIMRYDSTSRGEEIAQALGATPRSCLTSTFGNIAIFSDEAEIARLTPDMARVSALDRVALIATAPGATSDIVIRVFAPAVGLPEDPVCGTAHRIIIPYWAKQIGKTTIHSRHLSPRGGDLWCTLEEGMVAISGDCADAFAGTLTFPDSV